MRVENDLVLLSMTINNDHFSYSNIMTSFLKFSYRQMR